MTFLFIRATNAKFQARDEGAEYDSPEAAMASGARSALVIAAEELDKGQPYAAVEISVEREDGVPVLRSVLAVSVSPLLTPPCPVPLD